MTSYVPHGHARGAWSGNLDRIKCSYQVDEKLYKVLLIYLWCHPHLHFHHVDGVPAPFDLLWSIASLLDENYSSEPIVQVPQVHRRHATFKVAFKKTQTQTYTHIGRQVIKCSKSYNFRTGTRSTYRSLYWSKALLASTSSFLRRTEGIAPSSIGGSYLLLHGDLMDKEGGGQSVELYKEIYRTRSVIYCAGDLVQKRHWETR